MATYLSMTNYTDYDFQLILTGYSPICSPNKCSLHDWRWGHYSQIKTTLMMMTLINALYHEIIRYEHSLWTFAIINRWRWNLGICSTYNAHFLVYGCILYFKYGSLIIKNIVNNFLDFQKWKYIVFQKFRNFPLEFSMS